VRPESVKLVLKWGYAAHLTLLCLVDDAFTRLWVLSSTMLTCAAHQPQGATHPPSIRPSTRLSTPAPSYQCPEAEGIPPRWRPGRYLYSVHLKPLTGVKAHAWLGLGVGLRLG